MSRRDPKPAAPPPTDAAQRLADEHGLDTQEIEGTGAGGRLLQRDVMAALANLADEDEYEDDPMASQAWTSEEPAPAPPPQLAVEAVELGRLQQLIHRWGAAFEHRHGLSLSLQSFVIKAVVDALATVPDANVQLREGQAERNQYYDVAIAMGGPERPRVPVLRSPQRKSFAEIEGELARFGRQVADRSLPAEAETGAVITLHQRPRMLLSSVPLEPPQCLALALHRVQDAPVVVEGASGPTVAIRPVCQLSLSWDPRALHAELAAALLHRVKQGLEEPERLWLEA